MVRLRYCGKFIHNDVPPIKIFPVYYIMSHLWLYCIVDFNICFYFLFAPSIIQRVTLINKCGKRCKQLKIFQDILFFCWDFTCKNISKKWSFCKKKWLWFSVCFGEYHNETIHIFFFLGNSHLFMLCHCWKHVWFVFPVDVVFNLHDLRCVSFL